MLRRYFVDLLLVCLPVVFLLWALPIEMYLANQRELNHNLMILAPFVVVGLAYATVAALLLRVVNERWAQILAMFGCWIGLWVIASDFVAPVQLEALEGDQTHIPEPVSLVIIEGALIMLIYVGMGLLPAGAWRRGGSYFCLVLLVMQPLRLVGSMSGRTNFNDPDASIGTSDPPSVASSGPNIYHLVFDAYSGNYFEDAIQSTGLQDRFSGVIFYPNNRTNHFSTVLSRPSYLTGTLFEGGSLKDWIDAQRDGGIPAALYDAGYTLSLYLPYRGLRHKKASHVVTNIGLINEANWRILALQFADLWLVRAVPTVLQNEVYWEGRGLTSRLFFDRWADPDSAMPASGEHARPVASAELLRRLIRDEAQRSATGNFVDAHIYIPHGPYVLDRNCNYVPEVTGYPEQVDCTTRLIADFFDELRRLGRYRDSLIFIHADHGSWEHGPQQLQADIATPDVAAGMAQNVRQINAAYVENQTRALLLMKPPGRSDEPLEVSDWNTQLLDVASTIIGVAPNASAATQGHNLLDSDFPRDREIHVYMGYKQRGKDGEAIYFGQDFEQGTMNHYSVRNGRWSVHPNRQVEW